MNLEEYKQKKIKEKEEFNSQKRRDLCLKCFRPSKTCYCKFINSFDTKSKFIILLHPKEFKDQKVGTGRLSHLTLTNSELIMGTDFTNDKKVNELINDSKYMPLVLYPGKKAFNVSKGEFKSENLNGKIPLIFVIDATWFFARKMMRLSKNLLALPRISFDSTYKSEFIIKQQPLENCLSTIESIYILLNEMEKVEIEKLDGKQESLLNVFREMVKFQIKCTLDESLPSYRKHKFKNVSDRHVPSRWKRRNLFLD